MLSRCFECFGYDYSVGGGTFNQKEIRQSIATRGISGRKMYVAGWKYYVDYDFEYQEGKHAIGLEIYQM